MDFAVWKFNLILALELDIEMPIGAEILTVQTQHNKPVMWCLCDPEAPLTTRKFKIVLTGTEFDAKHCKYIGTFQTDGGAHVGHVFEVGSPRRDSDPNDYSAGAALYDN